MNGGSPKESYLAIEMASLQIKSLGFINPGLILIVIDSDGWCDDILRMIGGMQLSIRRQNGPLCPGPARWGYLAALWHT